MNFRIVNNSIEKGSGQVWYFMDDVHRIESQKAAKYVLITNINMYTPNTHPHMYTPLLNHSMKFRIMITVEPRCVDTPEMQTSTIMQTFCSVRSAISIYL